MISERQIVNGFQGLWNEILPLLTPHFIKLFNEAYGTSITNVDGQRISAVPNGTESDAAVVSELAFKLACLAHKEKVQAVTMGDSLVAAAKEYAIAKINQLVGSKGPLVVTISDTEVAEGIAIAGVYEGLLSKAEHGVVEFSPQLHGSGFIDACRGDLAIGSCLYEVKTVKRNIASKDLRQLLVYLALRHAAGENPWIRAGFFNPRRAIVYSFETDRLIPLISGGKFASEVFRDMVEAFGMRDIQLDLAF